MSEDRHPLDTPFDHLFFFIYKLRMDGKYEISARALLKWLATVAFISWLMGLAHL